MITEEEDGDEDVFVFFPLPVNLRGEKQSSEPGYWIRGL
jgi:hypothetical protein